MRLELATTHTRHIFHVIDYTEITTVKQNNW